MKHRLNYQKMSLYSKVLMILTMLYALGQGCFNYLIHFMKTDETDLSYKALEQRENLSAAKWLMGVGIALGGFFYAAYATGYLVLGESATWQDYAFPLIFLAYPFIYGAIWYTSIKIYLRR